MKCGGLLGPQKYQNLVAFSSKWGSDITAAHSLPIKPLAVQTDLYLTSITGITTERLTKVAGQKA